MKSKQEYQAFVDEIRYGQELPAQTHRTVQRCTPDAGSPLPDLSASGSTAVALITMRNTRDDVIALAAANQQRCAVSDEARALFELDT